MEYKLQVRLPGYVDEYQKVIGLFGDSENWEINRPRRGMRGPAPKGEPSFWIKLKKMKGTPKALLLMLAGSLIQVSVEKILINSDDGSDQIKIENFNKIEIKQMNVVIYQSDSCTADELIDLAKKIGQSE
jgi:hypothetical protein